MLETTLERLPSGGLEIWSFTMRPDTAGAVVKVAGVPSGDNITHAVDTEGNMFGLFSQQ